MKLLQSVLVNLVVLTIVTVLSANTMAQSLNSSNSGKSNSKNNSVLIGAMMNNNIADFRLYKKLKLGNGIMTFVPEDKEKLVEMAKYCRDNQIYLNFWEVSYRGPDNLLGVGWGRIVPKEEYFSQEDFNSIIDAAGPYYFGRYVIGEIGLKTYGPENYEIDYRGHTWNLLPQVNSMNEAKDAYVDFAKQRVDFERTISKGPLINVDAGMTFKYLAQAGLDKLCLEMLPGDPHLMLASIRGAAKAFNLPWGVHIAMAHYGGMGLDELWQRRWKTSLDYAYISGAEFIWKETSPTYYTERLWEGKRGLNDPDMKKVRATLREAYQFANIHTRPPEGPKVSLGIVYGNDDGAPGLWNRVVWGQYSDDKWLEGPSERGWNLVNKIFRKEEWANECVQGENDFSGNPPYGLYDIVPIEAPIDILEKYSALVFLSWNTMTEEIYGKLKSYVSSGGHLVMFLPQLSTETDRSKEIKLFRNGDFSDLFGVKVMGKGRKKIQGIKCFRESSLKGYHFPRWRVNTDARFYGMFTPANVKLTSGHVISGYSDTYRNTEVELEKRPVLIENSLGKGTAFLVTAYEYPADEGMIRFSNDILRTILQGEQANDIRIISSDQIRYSVYEGVVSGSKMKYKTIYMLNTDPEVTYFVKLWINEKISKEIDIPANSLKLAYLCNDLLLVPDQKTIDIELWKQGKSEEDFHFFNAVEQKMEILNMGNNSKSISVNGINVTCIPDSNSTIILKKRVDPERIEFFADDFLTEPFVSDSELK